MTGGVVSVPPLLILISSNVVAFIIGMAGPWHYSDFASTTRAGADTARRLRRKINEIRSLLFHILKAAEKTSALLVRSRVAADSWATTVTIGEDRPDHFQQPTVATTSDAFLFEVQHFLWSCEQTIEERQRAFADA
jgi:hypothetical protein